jgi:hypothetical protein
MLVAIGTIGMVGLFGNNLRQLFGGASAALGGRDAVTNGGQRPPSGVHWNLHRPGGTRDNNDP